MQDEQLLILALQGWVPLLRKEYSDVFAFRKFSEKQELIYKTYSYIDGTFTGYVWIRKDLTENFHLVGKRYRTISWDQVDENCLVEFLKLSTHDTSEV